MMEKELFHISISVQPRPGKNTFKIKGEIMLKSKHKMMRILDFAFKPHSYKRYR
jgi:hypothetical protein